MEDGVHVVKHEQLARTTGFTCKDDRVHSANGSTYISGTEDDGEGVRGRVVDADAVHEVCT